MKLIAFADLHHYSGDRETAIFNKTQKLTQFALPMLCQLIDRVNNQYKPDAVVNLGDSIQDANNVDMDITSLKEVADKFKEFNCPCYTVLGNHDLKMFDKTEPLEKILGFDSFNYSLDIDGYHLVFMTNGMIPELGPDGGGVIKCRKVLQETLDFLEKDLAKNDKPCIIFNHFPFFLQFGIGPQHLIENVDEVFDIFDKHKNIIGVISGHTHIAYSNERKGVKYHVLGCPIASPERNNIPDALYYEIDVENSEIKITEHKFDIKE